MVVVIAELNRLVTQDDGMQKDLNLFTKHIQQRSIHSLSLPLNLSLSPSFALSSLSLISESASRSEHRSEENPYRLSQQSKPGIVC